MRRKQKSHLDQFEQQALFSQPDVQPAIPPECVPVVTAALAELLLSVCAPTRSEVSDEPKDY
jgi:hypothetical protein